MRKFGKMLKIEGRLNVRDMNMVIFAIIMPVIVLVIMGVIYGRGSSFLEQSIGAICSISICAGGLMGLPIAISDYREKKILKKFHVTPVSPVMLIMVHLAIYTLYSVASALIIWLLGATIWGLRLRGSFFAFLGGWLLVVISIFSIGVLVGGVAKNSKQASVIASALYFPMLVFSGATLPYEVMPRVMQKIVNVMPLTEGIKILKAATTGVSAGNVVAPIVVMVVIAVLCTSLAIKLFRWE